ncbi:MAG: DNA-directed RNA polymerase subunit alpha [Candidatus Komeilibacteria bacterium RIFCSPHIGHO2_01_FULL_52_14]|uniref:DNA-directed RNA polymerase subunit alpha n=1 Tax=Candidatus Komeilibacteria bacterium RIFCSPHIGHO2_01_FULL_52_14 TaxID=1798549 RepID=A0A1G2BLA3_9BACT|nr:MAG: DNA-directed RNA polymerase subunit alpha [Candidatus Komeilibacteria bacterium RIFCSPHIGHO2_01_FULL_52_14]
MASISVPSNITYREIKANLTEVTIEPCYPGYGTTIGNGLRRVLLSSLAGSAVSAVKIEGIQHEYDTIENMKEDIVEIMMNLKKLRVVSHSDEPVVLELHAKGEKEVTAGDIKKNSDVDVVNKDLVIATLTDKKAELNMEITVKKGIGYEPIEERTVDKKEIGLMQIDSIFSPIQNVGFNIESVRVGQRTDYEKIVLTITTDGSMTAEAAVAAAVVILQDQFAAITTAEVNKESAKESKKKAKAAAAEAAEKAEEASEAAQA